jgi:AraC family ethanolamine operon transcriptional activator
MVLIQTMQGQFASVEEFSQSISRAGWSTLFQQLDCGHGGASFSIVKSDTAVLQHLVCDRSVRQRVSPLQGHHNFGILCDPSSTAKMGNRQLHSESINCFHSEDGFEAVSTPGFTAYTLSFNKRRIAELAQNLGYANLDDNEDIWGAAVAPVAAQLATIKAKMQQISNLANNVGLMPERIYELQELLELELPALLLQSFQHAEVVKPITPRNRARTLKRALAYIDAHPREALTVEELCIESASSLSTLERAFRECYAVSPKRFMLLQRLNKVRQALVHPAESRKIFEIANEYGFWHMSKFAADYKRVFGQLPSQTQNSTRFHSNHSYSA